MTERTFTEGDKPVMSPRVSAPPFYTLIPVTWSIIKLQYCFKNRREKSLTHKSNRLRVIFITVI